MRITANARRRRGPFVAGAVLLMLVLAACSPGQSDPVEAEAEPVTAEEAIQAVWAEFITAAAGQVNLPEPDALATDGAWAAAAAVFTEPRLPQTFVPQITIDDDGTAAEIEDCSLFSFPLIEEPYIRLSGRASVASTVAATDGGTTTWLITDLEIRPTERCLPADLATEILSAYEQFWDNELVFSDPPDPNHLLIEQTLTGRRLQRKRAVLEWQVENNASYRGRPTTSPGISDAQPGLAIVLDCQIPDPDTGFYDDTTGERRPELPPPNPGQTDLVQTWLELDDGRWKVEFSGVEADSGCDSAGPPDDAMEIVGPADP